MTENAVNEQKATGFLKVLCILTIVGSSLSIFSSLAYQDEAVSAAYGWYYWLMLLLSVGTLYGAIQMLKLSKTGLYIWTACEVLSIILPWIIVRAVINEVTSGAGVAGAAVEQAANSMANTIMIASSIIPAAFIIMYWMNAKLLK